MDDISEKLKKIVITTSRLILRIPTNEEIVALGEVLAEGIQKPGEPFFQDQRLYNKNPEEAEKLLDEIVLDNLKTWEKEDWHIPFAIFYGNNPIGLITMYSKDFLVTRGFGASYWIGLPYQGKGFGTEALQGVLSLGFDGLEAREAYCGAWSDNVASLHIMEKLGFIPNGEYWMVKQGQAVKDKRMKLSKENWSQPSTIHISHFDGGLFL